MRPLDINIDALLLDPNNYRLQDEQGFRVTPDDRFDTDQVQRSTFQKIKNTGIKELKESIIANGFLPIERIVVASYGKATTANHFLVIEGNRRVAALRQIKDEIAGGVEIPHGVEQTLRAVPCLVIEEEGRDAFFRETLMGIRHVGGIKEWGGYQRAKLIADLIPAVLCSDSNVSSCGLAGCDSVCLHDGGGGHDGWDHADGAHGG